jgi:beta-lactamase class A
MRTTPGTTRPLVSRRTVLGAALLLPLAACAGQEPPARPAVQPPTGTAAPDGTADRFAELERQFDAHIGVFAVDTGTGRTVTHRADERFAMCSTFKGLAAAAVLDTRPPEHLDALVRYGRGDLVTYSPITEQHVGTGMSIRDLCDAAVRYSDNTAGNLLLDDIGGPPALTAFVRSLGDGVTRLDRRETELNSAVPGDERDTTTPRAIASSYRELVLGDRLQAQARDLLIGWLVGNTTGGDRIRAGLPGDWRVGDKTGGGSYGTLNDVAVAWPPAAAPVVVAVLTTRPTAGADAGGDPAAVAQAAAVAAAALTPAS